MSTITNSNQLLIAMIRYLPSDINRNVRATELQKLASIAWDNGWRDPQWLAEAGLAGTSHESARDACALFVHQLSKAIETPSPEVSTPTPPPIDETWDAIHRGHSPSSNPSYWAEQCRRNIRGGGHHNGQ